jgi:hypothetical protein
MLTSVNIVFIRHCFYWTLDIVDYFVLENDFYLSLDYSTTVFIGILHKTLIALFGFNLSFIIIGIH